MSPYSAPDATTRFRASSADSSQVGEFMAITLEWNEGMGQYNRMIGRRGKLQRARSRKQLQQSSNIDTCRQAKPFGCS
jgi:hypothetical protein